MGITGYSIDANCEGESLSIQLSEKPLNGNAPSPITFQGRRYYVSISGGTEKIQKKVLDILKLASFENLKAECEKQNIKIGKIKTKISITPQLSKLKHEEVQNRQTLAAYRKQVFEDLTAGKPARAVAKEFSEKTNVFIASLYESGIQELGAPPCAYSIVVFGSLSRLESGPFPDIDNMILVETKNDETIRYFSKLHQYVADRIYRLGESMPEKSGIHFCSGGLTPRHQHYDKRYAAIDTLDEQAYTGSSYLYVEVSEKDPTLLSPEELRSTPEQEEEIAGIVKAMTDSRHLLGSSDLYSKYMEMRAKRRASTKTAESAIHSVIKQMKQDTHSPIMTQKLPEILYHKGALYRFPQVIIAYLAEIHGISYSNTFQRIDALCDAGVLEKNFAKELSNAVEHLVKCRILSQTAYKEEFELVSTGNWDSFCSNQESMQKELAALVNKKEKSKDDENRIRQLSADISLFPKIAKMEYASRTDSGKTERKEDRRILSPEDLSELRMKTLPTLHKLFELLESGKTKD